MLPRKILFIRFSAMGDVVLLVPMLRSLLAKYPDLDIHVLTRPKFAAFFQNIKGVTVIPADVDKEYKGLKGLWRLFQKLKSEKFELIIDLHDHLRTKFLRSLFFLTGIHTEVFKKGRSEKKQLTRSNHKLNKVLPHTVERYQEVLERCGYHFPLLEGPHLLSQNNVVQVLDAWLVQNDLPKKERWIGVAPFAMHRSKIWPLENYHQLLSLLLQKETFRFFLFGGGAKEIAFFNSLKKEFPTQVTIIAGVMKLDQELALMKKLDLMLCVDSSNMHFAVLTGAPVLSIWGGTHPSVGFGPFQRNEESIIQISNDELSCRPCSVYGKETCARGDFACMTMITPQMVAERVSKSLL